MKFETDSLNKMSEEISGFVDDLCEAVDCTTGVTKKYKHVLICGMGASAIGGTIFADSMYYTSRISVDVTKALAIPRWVDKDTLFVACSYSGNTYETLSMYKQALDAGLNVVAITHGGELMRLSEQNKNPLIVIGGKPMQPRSAIGWFIGTLAAVIEDAGGPGLRHQIKSMIENLRDYKEELESKDGISWRIANALDGKAPVVYGAPDMTAIATRMKNQLNENSKIIAFSGVIPEFNHNEIVGWYDDKLRTGFLPIVIMDTELEDVTKIAKATIKVLRSRSVEPIVVIVKGKTILERNIYALMVGDYTSLYIASLHKVDPCNVDPIVDIKARMKMELDT